MPPIYGTSVFTFPTLEAADLAFDQPGSFVYSRMGNPNTDALGSLVASLEGAEAGLATASGQGAILVSLLSLLAPGKTLHYAEHLYGGTLALVRNWISKLNPIRPFDAWEDEPPLAEGDLLFVESLSNPLVRPSPLGRLADRAAAAGAQLLVDNTFATPVACRPLERGADMVVHSLTKGISGHAHVILGGLAGRHEAVARAQRVAVELGLAADPRAAWLAQEGAKTLFVRLDRAQKNAVILASRLKEQPAVVSVHHPSLLSAAETVDLLGPGALMAFDLGSFEAASRFVAALRLIAFAPSLGDVATTISHPGRTSHRGLGPEEKASLGIGPGLIRLSVGIEDPEDIWADLKGGLMASLPTSKES